MDSLSPSTASVNWNEYQRRGQATRSRRPRPSKEQDAALRLYFQRDGIQRLSVAQLGLLATHPHLTSSQRAEFATLAQKAIAQAVR